MAVYDYYGKESYVGCVLDTYEHNMAWDSYWYATVWDEETHTVKDVMYDTTAAGSGQSGAIIDFTPEVLRKVYRYCFDAERKFFDETVNVSMAKEIHVGDVVVAVKGRKVKKGSVAEVFWKGKCWNRYGRYYEERVGLLVDGEKIFATAENFEPVDWMDRLLTGKARKEEIRKMTKRMMPSMTAEYIKYLRCA